MQSKLNKIEKNLHREFDNGISKIEIVVKKIMWENYVAKNNHYKTLLNVIIDFIWDGDVDSKMVTMKGSSCVVTNY